MNIKKLFASVALMTFWASYIYAAEVIEDDSTPYMPYPERVEPVNPEPAPAPKTQTKPATTKKKATTKKATPAKKKTTTKTTKKAAAPKQSSLDRGIALMQAERYEAAKPYLLKAIQENRNNPNAWYWYGVYHEKTGKFSQAQYFFTKALAIDPTLEPLSRVVYYPNDNEKTPLWDPKRPARVYPVETAKTGMTIGTGNFPSAPNDPVLPQVPVYTPPEPNTSPTDGDSWSPALYVPPSPEEITDTIGEIEENNMPVYNPPQASSVEVEKISDTNTTEIYSYKIPGYSNTYNSVENSGVRADLPLYNPPEPGKIVAQAPKQAAPAPKAKTEATPVATKKTTQTAAAPRKIVKKSTTQTQNKNTTQTKKAAPAKTQTKKNTNTTPKTSTPSKPAAQPKAQPKTQTQTQPATQPAKTNTTRTNQTQTRTQQTQRQAPTPKVETPKQETPKPQPKQATPTPTQQVQQQQTPAPAQTPTPAPATSAPRPRVRLRSRSQEQTTQSQTTTNNPEPPKQTTPASRNNSNESESNRQVEYLPPVGQFAPDPGTIVEPEIPPVGQRN